MSEEIVKDPQVELVQKTEELMAKVESGNYSHHTTGKGPNKVLILEKPIETTENISGIPDKPNNVRVHRYMIVSPQFGLGSIKLNASEDPLVPSREPAFLDFIKNYGDGKDTSTLKNGAYPTENAQSMYNYEFHLGAEVFPITLDEDSDSELFQEAIKSNLQEKRPINESQALVAKRITNIDRVLTSL